MSGNVKVVARFRPPNALELREGGDIVVGFSAAAPGDFDDPHSQQQQQAGEETVKILPAAGAQGADAQNGFTFDRVFPMGARQSDVFEYGIRETVDDVINGYNGTIFAYGQTGSGKTFTMMGSDIDDTELKGVIPRITERIITAINTVPENMQFTLRVNYMEIYMEKIRDLLAPNNDNLQIHEDKTHGVYVKGLSDHWISSIDEVYNALRMGGHSRAVSSTNMNAESSRSHSIFIMRVEQTNLNTGAKKTGNLFLVDLAGSEKVGKTGASGQTLEEAKKINKSLSALGMVINALTDGKSSHIPYRDSKLTRILQESLGGNSRTTLIVNCSPCAYNLEETISTLRFGMRAKSIKNKARVNAELSPAELKALLKKVKAESDRYQAYAMLLEAELKTWRSGGKVPESEWADMAKAVGGVPPPSNLDSPSPAGSRFSAHLQAGPLRPQSPAVELLSKELSSRPETPTAVSLDKDEREEFLRRENELADQISERENALKGAEANLREALEELKLLREQEREADHARSIVTSQLNEVKMELERVTYEHKEAGITMDILKEQNADLNSELEELRKNLNETAAESKASGARDAAQDGRKERKKAEKMAKMMADFNAGIVSKKEEQIRDTLAKLENYTGSSGGELSKEDLAMLREQLLESQTVLREQQEQVRQAVEENEVLEHRRVEAEARFRQLEAEYEELLDQKTRGDSDQNVADLKSKLEVQYTAKREAQQSEMDELKRQLELKNKELNALQTTNEGLKGTNDELKRAFAITAAGVEGGKNLAESAREMERVRKTMMSQLAEFDSMKKSLMRDLQNRCEKVVELEISLDESKEQYNNVVRSSNAKAQQKKMAFLERNLEQLTHVQKQLVEQNSTLKKDIAVAERKLMARTDRIAALEASLAESQIKLDVQNRKFEVQIQGVRDKLEHAKNNKAAMAYAQQAGGGMGGAGTIGSAGMGQGLGFGRIAKPLRGGGAAVPDPTALRPATGGPSTEAPKSRSNWFFSSSSKPM